MTSTTTWPAPLAPVSPTLVSALAPTAARAASLNPGSSLPRLFSEQLFGPRSEIEIEHRGSVYRLRITSLGKLILTK